MTNLKCPKGHDVYPDRTQNTEQFYLYHFQTCETCNRPYFEMDCIKDEVCETQPDKYCQCDKPLGNALRCSVHHDQDCGHNEDNSCIMERYCGYCENVRVSGNCVFDYNAPKPRIWPRYYCTTHESWFCGTPYPVLEVYPDEDKDIDNTPYSTFGRKSYPITSDKDGCKNNPDQCVFENKSIDGDPFNCAPYCQTHKYEYKNDMPKCTCIDKIIEALDYNINTLLYKIEESEPVKLFARALKNTLKELKDK